MLKTGLMMDRPLLLADVIEHAAQQFADVEVVSRETHGPLFRYTYADCAARARQLANALASLGLQPGDAVGTIAWNNHRHMEAYFAVSGSGMVLHTCNPRLSPQQLIYIINHAEDQVVLFDATFAPLVKGIAAHCPQVRAWVCLAEAAHTPAIDGVANVLAYEDLIAPCSNTFDWPSFDERTAAALCYTSGTTGNPKGALYSHPYAAPIAGAKLVLPGPKLDGQSLYELMEAEAVTISAGVPTIWQGLLAHMEQHGLRFSTMRCTAVGGSAMPQPLIAKFMETYNVEVRHGWGMTETTAVATIGTLPPASRDWTPAQRHALLAKQGKSVFGIDIKVVDDAGATLPRDGTSQGELMVRGQWIVSAYYKGERSPLVDGWFPTGDIATIDAQGVMQIRDRTKDVIKTGGEWISSLELESAAIAHPAVAMAAVIGVKHPKWDERPLLFLVLKPGHAVTKDEILAFVGERVPKWWVPDDVVFLDALPVGGTGKVQKGDLRKQYGGVFG